MRTFRMLVINPVYFKRQKYMLEYILRDAAIFSNHLMCFLWFYCHFWGCVLWWCALRLRYIESYLYVNIRNTFLTFHFNWTLALLYFTLLATRLRTVTVHRLSMTEKWEWALVVLSWKGCFTCLCRKAYTLVTSPDSSLAPSNLSVTQKCNQNNQKHLCGCAGTLC